MTLKRKKNGKNKIFKTIKVFILLRINNFHELGTKLILMNDV